jgi:hypothetical protein
MPVFVYHQIKKSVGMGDRRPPRSRTLWQKGTGAKSTIIKQSKWSKTWPRVAKQGNLAS